MITDQQQKQRSPKRNPSKVLWYNIIKGCAECPQNQIRKKHKAPHEITLLKPEPLKRNF